jgi:hypothetical protein
MKNHIFVQMPQTKAIVDQMTEAGAKASTSLFHYTTGQGLLGIARDRCMFATHADFSNDSFECKLVRPPLTKLLQAQFEEIVPQLIELGVLDSALFEEHGKSFYEKQAEQCVNLMLRAVNNVSPYFITSFCIHARDSYEYSNGLLSQWRGAFLRTILRMQEMPYRIRVKANAILGKKTMPDIGRHFLPVGPFLKHIGFKEETEYRIVALCNRPTQADEGDTRASKEIRFMHRSDGRIVPYIALYDGLRRALPIKAVIIGPHANQDNQRHAVELLLEQHAIDAEIRLSEIPFRG